MLVLCILYSLFSTNKANHKLIQTVLATLPLLYFRCSRIGFIKNEDFVMFVYGSHTP